MSLSTGTRRLISEAVTWGAGALVIAMICINADSFLGLGAGSEDDAVSTSATRRIEGSGAAAATPNRARQGQTVEIAASENGHFHAEAEINGQTLQVLVDTGATMVALTYEDAESAGIYLKPSDFSYGVNTANGVARVASVMIDRISIGDITVRNVRGTVSERGRLSTSLLGMSFLSRLERVDMRAGVLVLKD